jgi:amino acid transporter
MLRSMAEAKHGTLADGSAGSALVRGIGRWGLTAFALNLTVGSGIMGLPSRLAALTGTYSIFVVMACGLLIAAIAICFAEVAGRFEATGGPQLYATVAFGQGAGFIVGWLLWISRLGTCAAVANLMMDYAQVLLPALSRSAGRDTCILIMIAAYAALNVTGIRQTAAVSTAFTLAKMLPLCAIAVAGVFFVDPRTLRLGALPGAGDSITAFLLATFAFFGFDTATVLAGEVDNPRRSVPFAIFVSVGIVTILYALMQFVCVGTLPNLGSSDRPVADVASLIAGAWASAAVAAMTVLACAGVYGASITPATRLLYAMADQHQLPRWLSRVNPRLHTPIPAIVISSGAALALALSGSFIYLVKVTLIARMAVYAATCLALPALRRRTDIPAATVRVPGGNVVASGCAVLCVALLARSSMREALDVVLGTIAGLVIFGGTRVLGPTPAPDQRLK